MKTLNRRRQLNIFTTPVILFSISISLAAARLSVASRPVSAGQTGTQAAETQPDLKAFVGTWKGSFQGEVLAILILKQDNGRLKGTLNDFDLVFDKHGNLAEGTHVDFGDAPLLNVHFKGGAMFFSAIEKDQYRPATEWKFVPLNPTEGELTPLLDNQLDKPKELVAKPIHMVRKRIKP